MNAMMKRLGLTLIVAALTIGSAACTGPVTKGEQSLYNRLGTLANGDGKAAIGAVIDKFLENVAADERINRFFVDSNLPALRFMLVEQVCEAAGGPCKYPGRDMVATHTGMNITEAEFIALVEDLRDAMEEVGVPIRETNEVIALLAPMKRDIEYK